VLALIVIASSRVEAGSITLSWDPNAEPDIAGYIVYYGPSSGNYTNNTNVGNVTTWTVPGLTDGQLYYFAVRAYNTAGQQSPLSAEVSGAIDAPAQLTAPTPGSTFTTSSVLFQWSAGAGVSAYRLSVGTALGGTTLFDLNVGTLRSQTVTGLPTNGSTIYVRLWSLIGTAWRFADYTFTASASLPGAPSSPTPPNAVTGQPTALTLAWTATGATSYDVKFGTTNPPPTVTTSQSAASLLRTGLTPGTTYFWQIIARNGTGTTNGPVWSFTTQSLPAAPGTPTPANAATGQATALTLAWTATGATSYDVKFGTTNPPPTVATGQSAATLSRTGLTAGATYFWQIIANNGAGSTSGPVWSFTTQGLPAAPSAPTPANAATGQATAPTLRWTAAGATSYDVKFGTANPPPTVTTSQSPATYAPTGLAAGTTYFWQVVARNSAGNTSGPIWSFTTLSAPGVPGTPNPANAATGQPTGPTLTWTATGATSYDVKFGTTNPPPTLTTAQSAATYVPAALSTGTIYYWQIVARNAAGNTSGPVWSFTTAGLGVSLTSDRPSPQAAGTPVTFTAIATGGTAPYQYQFWLDNGTTWTILQPWSTTATLTWTPTVTNANYYIVAWMRSAGNTANQPEKYAVMSYVIAPPISAVTLTSDRPAPQAPGTAVTFTATATGGATPYEFQWWVDNGTTWTIAKPWSTSPTFTWTPTTANASYYIVAWARSAGNTNTYEQYAGMGYPIQTASSAISSVTLTSDKASPQAPGTTVTFTAAATGGTAPYQYQWWLDNGITATVVKAWSTSPTFTWTPTTTNANYYVIVWARSAGNTVNTFEQYAVKSYAIQPLITSVTLTANRTAPQPPGTSVTFTASATGGAAPYQYQYWVDDGTTWTVVRAWSTSATFTWTPTTANASYTVVVWARSAGNTANVQEQYAFKGFPIQ
jgi:hypothetical protein